MGFRSRDRRPPKVDHGRDELVPVGMRIAGAWAWRLLAIFAVIGVLIFLIIQLRIIIIPVLVAVILAALLVPFCNWLQRRLRFPKWLAVTVSELGLIAVVSGMIVLVVTEIRREFGSLQRRTVRRYEELREFVVELPFEIESADVDRYLLGLVETLQEDTEVLFAGALSVGTTAGQILAGVLIALFTTLFFLIDGHTIWQWVVRLFPQRARTALSGSGAAGWITLTTFVKVQIFVAAVDAIGIGLGVFFLGLPLAIPIGVAVFLGAFIPVIGAVVTGALAVFVALVYEGPVWALIMLAIVLGVQQFEGNVLQPLVMGTAVRVHPLAVVLAVTAGGIVAGIPGAFFAVPLVALLNVMVGYIARGTWRENPNPTIDDLKEYLEGGRKRKR